MIYKNNKEVQNDSYINKDFQALWGEILNLIPKFTNKWDPRSANESDPLAVLLKLLAIYSDKLNYNIDKSILERFPQTLTELRSAKNVYEALGYNAPWYKAASAYITLNYNLKLSTDGSINDDTKFSIPRFTMVCDEDLKILYTLVDRNIVEFTVKEYSRLSPLFLQGKIQDYSINGVDIITVNNLDSHNRLYFTEPNIAQNGIFISSNADFTDDNNWKEVDNIYQSVSPYSYQFGVDPVSGACYIEFSDNIANTIGSGLHIKYIVTDGLNGNVKARSITRFYEENLKCIVDGEEGPTVNDSIVVQNSSATQNGANPATIEEMYTNYKKVKNTFDTLVTLLDYENYLYQYEKEGDGQNVVSNIRVSDRTNDLYDSYRVYTLNTSQEVLKTKVVKDNLDGKPLMDANSVKFYPLNPISLGGISDKNSFDNTFENTSFFIGNGVVNPETFGEKNVENDYESLMNVVKDTKVLTTDINEKPQSLIKIPYTLKGLVYLNHKVSKYQSDEIKVNINQALFDNLNAREMEFGQEVSYEKLLNIIKNSDDRISYVALDPPKYNEPTLPDVKTIVDGELGSVTEGLDIRELAVRERAILSGVTPWTSFEEDFNMYANQTGGEVKNFNADDNNNIQIKSRVDLDTTDKTYYQVLTNEDFVAFAPQYRDVKTYTNYLFCSITLISDNDDNGDKTINANTPYKLKNGESIEISEDRQFSNPYKLEEGKVIRANFNLTTTSDNNPIVLSSGKSISEISRIESGLGKDGDFIYWVTNSKELVDQLNGSNYESHYLLKTGEYLLFRVEGENAFTLFGEGNEIWSTSQITFTPGITDNWFKADWDSLKEGYNQNSIEWQKTNGNTLKYRLNQIYILGEGYIIKDEIEENNEKKSNFINYKGDGTVFTLGDFTYGLDENNLKPLPTLLDNDKWRGFIRLKYTLGNVGYPLYEGNSIDANGVIVNDTNKNYVSHTLTIKVTDKDSNPEGTSFNPSDANKPLYLQANLQIDSIGGSVVTLTKKMLETILGENVSFKIFQYGINTYIISSGYFSELKISTDPDNPTKWKVPGTENSLVAIFGAYSQTEGAKIEDVALEEANKIYMLIAKSGVDLAITVGNINISQIKIANNGSEVYNWSPNTDNPDNSVLIESLLLGADIAIIKPEYLGDPEFNPTHNINKNSLIEDPTYPISYFNKNHPLNRYSIAKWDVSSSEIEINSNSIEI